MITKDDLVVYSTTSAPDFGPPNRRSFETEGWRVETRSVSVADFPDRFWIQYAKPRENLQGTLGRLHLFLALGELGGTGLAFLAGFWVARRAMRPIAGLTQAAREVARTRDPAISLPKPEAKDEVAKLAHTLEDLSLIHI